jgi:hypothetical protein
MWLHPCALWLHICGMWLYRCGLDFKNFVLPLCCVVLCFYIHCAVDNASLQVILFGSCQITHLLVKLQSLSL